MEALGAMISYPMNSPTVTEQHKQILKRRPGSNWSLCAIYIRGAYNGLFAVNIAPSGKHMKHMQHVHHTKEKMQSCVWKWGDNEHALCQQRQTLTDKFSSLIIFNKVIMTRYKYTLT